MNELLKLPPADTTVDRLIEHVFDHKPLGEKDAEIYKRCVVAHDLLLNHYPDADVLSALKTRFPGLSISTYYRDIKYARLVFNRIVDVNLAYERWAWLQENKRLYQIAKDTDNLAVCEKLLSQLNKWMNSVKEDPIDPDQYGNHNYYFILPGTVQNNFQINLNHVDKLSDDQVNNIVKTIESNAVEETTKLLNEYSDRRE